MCCPVRAVDVGLLIVEARSPTMWLEYLLHHIEGHLASLQCKHVSKNVKVPSVSMLYPDWVIQFQQDRSYMYSCHVVQNGYHFRPMTKKPLIADHTSLQRTPLRICSQVKKTILENWSILHSRNNDAVWTFVSDTCWWSCLISTLCLIPESMLRQMWHITKA